MSDLKAYKSLGLKSTGILRWAHYHGFSLSIPLTCHTFWCGVFCTLWRAWLGDEHLWQPEVSAWCHGSCVPSTAWGPQRCHASRESILTFVESYAEQLWEGVLEGLRGRWWTHSHLAGGRVTCTYRDYHAEHAPYLSGSYRTSASYQGHVLVLTLEQKQFIYSPNPYPLESWFFSGSQFTQGHDSHFPLLWSVLGPRPSRFFPSISPSVWMSVTT